MDTSLTPKEACRNFLEKNEYAVLATVAKDNSAEASTLMYIFDDEWNIYICTRAHTDKVKNLKHNQTVAVVIGFGPAAEGVQIQGVAEKLEGEAADSRMVDFMVKRTSYYTTFLKFEGLDFEVYKITPKHIRYIHVDPIGDREVFTDIDFK